LLDFKLCRLEVTFSADGMTIDIEVVGDHSPQHKRVATAIKGKLVIQAENQTPGQAVLQPGGGDMPMTLPGRRRVIRQPDGLLRPTISSDRDDDPPAPRFIFEVSVSNKILQQAQIHCRDYFHDAPYLRAVLLVSLDRQRDGATKCVAVLYERDQHDDVVVADVVSFGSAPLDASDCAVLEEIERVDQSSDEETNGSLSVLEQIEVHRSRELPLAPVFPDELDPPCPWDEADRANIEIRAEHLYYRVRDPSTGRPVPVPADPLVIDLWVIYSAFESAF
jgi:hypothetical protein